MRPIGLGARDTLRTEMKYSLYGNEITDETHPFEAGLGWVVKIDSKDCLAKEALSRYKAEKPMRRLVGLKALERGIPRSGYSVWQSKELSASGGVAGVVTSGTYSPSLEKGIAVAYLPKDWADAAATPGQRLFVEIRGRPLEVEVVKTPFIRR